MKCAIHRQSGFSIVELLVAMVISLVLLTGVFQIFLGNSETYRINENYARLQENGRFALDFLTREVRSSGYYGCVSGSGTLQTTLNSATSFLYNFNRSVEGFESTGATAWTPTVDAGITSPLGGSDILTIRKIDFDISMRVSSDMTANDASIILSGVNGEDLNGDILLINDCQESWVFQSFSAGSPIVHNISTSILPGNSQDNFTYAFAAGAEVFRLETVSYYVRIAVNNQPALYRKIGISPAEEILQGVENMQVLYGEDTNNDGDVELYQPANSVANWNDVLSVRIGLLVRTPNEIAKADLDTNVYTLNGTAVDPTDDRRQRRVFIATIGLRNKLL
jgi:type IV pilus assembly protein PilW